MKLKKYIIWIASLIITLSFSSWFYSNARDLVINQILNKNQTIYFFILLSSDVLINILFGAAIGLDHFLDQVQTRNTPWRLNHTKFFIIVFPTLLISLIPFSSYLNLHSLALIFMANTTTVRLIQVLCGYSLIASFYKESN